jgi:hypothetical protein
MEKAVNRYVGTVTFEIEIEAENAAQAMKRLRKIRSFGHGYGGTRDKHDKVSSESGSQELGVVSRKIRRG